MATKINSAGKQSRIFLIMLAAFAVFAISAILYALSRNAILLVPMTIFGLATLVFLGWFVALVIKQPKSPIAKKVDEKAKESVNPLEDVKA